MVVEVEGELKENDPRSTAQLIEEALREDDESDAYWDIVWILRERATSETFEVSRELCNSDEIERCALGVHILAQLGPSPNFSIPPFGEDALSVILPLLDESRNAEPKMLGTIISALGHLKDERTAEPVAKFRHHPEEDIRLSVAMSLGGLEREVAIESLAELSQDEDPDVRDWATFGLGTLTEADTPEIRTALFNRLDDQDDDTRNEAIRGLVQRKDKRVLKALIRKLETENPQRLAIEAACIWASSDLLPALLQLKAIEEKAGFEDAELDEAIARCQSNIK